MSEQATREAIADLIAAFPRDRVPAETASLYMMKLSDVPPDALALAAHDLICTGERFPTIATIRRTVAERTLALPSEAEALAQIEARASAPGTTVDPVVRRVLRLVGGTHALRAADNPSIFRSQFLRLYRDAREAAVRDAQTGSFRALASGRPSGAVSCP